MDWEIRDDDGRYIIVPRNMFIYFWWAMYKNFKTLFVPMSYKLTRYYKTLEDARKELQLVEDMGR